MTTQPNFVIVKGMAARSDAPEWNQIKLHNQLIEMNWKKAKLSFAMVLAAAAVYATVAILENNRE